jgi:hypothetical protein
MRVSRRGAGLLALAALLLPGVAHADELLVMPYTCTMVGGQPLLAPAAERGHRILGPRDQRKFNACSPVNPDLCRQWTVHRFDLDCDGTRVPWVSVVAATNEGSRRAWLLNGRLVLRMGPRWSLPADDPCAQEPGADQRFDYRRMRRLCADRLALAPPPVVEMPFGYAPMLGIDGIFVKGAPAVAGGQPSLPPVAAAPPGSSQQGFVPPRGNPMPELFPSEPPPVWEPFADEGPGKPAAPPQAAPSQTPPPKVAATPPPAPAAVAPAIPPAVAEVPKAASSASKAPAPEPNLGPRIVTSAPAVKAATETAAPPPVAVGEAPKTASPAAKPAAPESPKVAAASPPPKAAEAPPRKAVEAPAAAPTPAAEPDSGGSGVSLLSVFRTTTVGALVAFGGLALGLFTAFALARRNESLRDARRRPRDLSAVSLGDKRASPPARIANARGNLPPNAAASAMSRTPGQTAAASAVADLGDRMPQTKTEAMQVLGIGVAPTASEAAIKKIVDGLRQSWHPDHAKDELDRALRELRSKQINAAWELLRAQRAVV